MILKTTRSRLVRVLDPQDEVGVCNCASCKRTLIGERTEALLATGDCRLGHETLSRLRDRQVHFVHSRDAGGRPYCNRCAGQVEADGPMDTRSGTGV